jgi:hypothetical protein
MTIPKQLIENMIGDYLNESYEGDLVESVFEEVSEETWEAIEEAILNELSPKTLASYVKKSKDDYAAQHGKLSSKSPRGDDALKTIKKMNKRGKGIDKAVDRLAK